jgi:hypothetical protein
MDADSNSSGRTNNTAAIRHGAAERNRRRGLTIVYTGGEGKTTAAIGLIQQLRRDQVRHNIVDRPAQQHDAVLVVRAASNRSASFFAIHQGPVEEWGARSSAACPPWSWKSPAVDTIEGLCDPMSPVP